MAQKPPTPQRPRSAPPAQAPRPASKTIQQALEDSAPWKPAAYELVDATAIQALARGEATKEQQIRALDWILYGACRLRDEPYRPGALEGDRDTAFALGQTNVGRQIAKLMTINIGVLRRNEPRADPTEQP